MLFFIKNFYFILLSFNLFLFLFSLFFNLNISTIILTSFLFSFFLTTYKIFYLFNNFRKNEYNILKSNIYYLEDYKKKFN